MRASAATKLFGLQAELLYLLLAEAPGLLLLALVETLAQRRRRRRLPLRVEAKTGDLSSSVLPHKGREDTFGR